VNGQARWHVGRLAITKIDEMVAPTTLSWLIPAAEPTAGYVRRIDGHVQFVPTGEPA
jgi:hypothetical protein